MSANTILMIYLLRKYSKLLTLGPNPRKYHVREMKFSAIRENIMSEKMSCPTVDQGTSRHIYSPTSLSDKQEKWRP